LRAYFKEIYISLRPWQLIIKGIPLAVVIAVFEGLDFGVNYIEAAIAWLNQLRYWIALDIFDFVLPYFAFLFITMLLFGVFVVGIALSSSYSASSELGSKSLYLAYFLLPISFNLIVVNRFSPSEADYIEFLLIYMGTTVVDSNQINDLISSNVNPLHGTPYSALFKTIISSFATIIIWIPLLFPIMIGNVFGVRNFHIRLLRALFFCISIFFLVNFASILFNSIINFNDFNNRFVISSDGSGNQMRPSGEIVFYQTSEHANRYNVMLCGEVASISGVNLRREPFISSEVLIGALPYRYNIGIVGESKDRMWYHIFISMTDRLDEDNSSEITLFGFIHKSLVRVADCN